jgi:hypothetical protein
MCLVFGNGFQKVSFVLFEKNPPIIYYRRERNIQFPCVYRQDLFKITGVTKKKSSETIGS